MTEINQEKLQLFELIVAIGCVILAFLSILLLKSL